MAVQGRRMRPVIVGKARAFHFRYLADLALWAGVALT
jgi:hypothetical protein